VKELSRERFIITGHDQTRTNRVIHFRRKLEDNQSTLEDVEAADAERDAAIAAGQGATAPARTAGISDNNDPGPPDERIITTNTTMLKDGTVIVIVKGWETESTPLGSKKKETQK